MVTKRVLIAAVLATFCLTATLFMIVPTRSQPSSYDPWTDVNDDGTIDMADIAVSINSFMTSGDPTKPVNVTNWPTSQAVTVWWNYTFPPLGTGTSSVLYNANGFGHLHLLLYVTNMSIGQSVTLRLQTEISDPTHTNYVWLSVPGANITVSGPGSGWSALTVAVPNDQFYFWLSSNVAGPGPYMFASYYLTWS
jgi:hypothetical protein